MRTVYDYSTTKSNNRYMELPDQDNSLNYLQPTEDYHPMLCDCLDCIAIDAILSEYGQPIQCSNCGEYFDETRRGIVTMYAAFCSGECKR